MVSSHMLTILIRFWHDNPPLAIVIFGIAFTVAWYANASGRFSSASLYLGPVLLVAGLAWEVLLISRRVRRRSVVR